MPIDEVKKCLEEFKQIDTSSLLQECDYFSYCCRCHAVTITVIATILADIHRYVHRPGVLTAAATVTSLTTEPAAAASASWQLCYLYLISCSCVSLSPCLPVVLSVCLSSFVGPGIVAVMLGLWTGANGFFRCPKYQHTRCARDHYLRMACRNIFSRWDRSFNKVSAAYLTLECLSRRSTVVEV